MKWLQRAAPDRLFVSSEGSGSLRRELRPGHWQAWLTRALEAASPAERLAWERGGPLTERALAFVWPAGMPAPARALLARGRGGGLWLEVHYDLDVDGAVLADDLIEAALGATGRTRPLVHAEPVSHRPAQVLRPQPILEQATVHAPAARLAPLPVARTDEGDDPMDALHLADVEWLNPGDPLHSPRHGLCRVARIPRPGGAVRLLDASGREFEVTPTQLCAEFRHALDE